MALQALDWQPNHVLSSKLLLAQSTLQLSREDLASLGRTLTAHLTDAAADWVQLKMQVCNMLLFKQRRFQLLTKYVGQTDKREMKW